MNLKNLSLFSSFNEKELDEIVENSTIKEYKKGDIVFYEQEEARYLMILLQGKIDLYKTNIKGKQLYIHTIEAVDFVGEVSAFNNIPFPTTAECISDCRLLNIDFCKVDKGIFEKVFFYKSLLDLTFDKIHALMGVIDNSFLTSQERVIKLLLKDAEIFKEATYTNIAKKLNMTPETLSRILNKLKKQNYIDINEDKSIEIISLNDLKTLCECE